MIGCVQESFRAGTISLGLNMMFIVPISMVKQPLNFTNF